MHSWFTVLGIQKHVGMMIVMTDVVDVLGEDKMKSGEQVFNNTKINIKAVQHLWKHIKRLFAIVCNKREA